MLPAACSAAWWHKQSQPLRSSSPRTTNRNRFLSFAPQTWQDFWSNYLIKTLDLQDSRSRLLFKTCFCNVSPRSTLFLSPSFTYLTLLNLLPPQDCILTPSRSLVQADSLLPHVAQCVICSFSFYLSSFLSFLFSFFVSVVCWGDH
jgi:hypothetical protein